MPTFKVNVWAPSTVIHRGCVEVEAQTAEEALELGLEHACDAPETIEWETEDPGEEVDVERMSAELMTADGNIILGPGAKGLTTET